MLFYFFLIHERVTSEQYKFLLLLNTDGTVCPMKIFSTWGWRGVVSSLRKSSLPLVCSTNKLPSSFQGISCAFWAWKRADVPIHIPRSALRKTSSPFCLSHSALAGWMLWSCLPLMITAIYRACVPPPVTRCSRLLSVISCASPKAVLSQYYLWISCNGYESWSNILNQNFCW